ncbi:MAG: DegV family protein, partial [Oscillospiraceae bacterium]|nr:DegV family protein [Oscillospiraceae bacterium]
MRDYTIFTDSSADLDPVMAEKLGVQVLPMNFILDGKTYANWPDGRELGFDDFYDRLRKGGMSSTSQVNTTEFIDMFRPYLQKGVDIAYIGLSSGLSGTVNSAFVAAEELMKEFPESKVRVVDSLSASLGEGLVVFYAAQMKKQGHSIDDTVDWINKHKLNFAHWFTVDDLDFLRRGGRLSGAVALFGAMLSIKPVLHVDNEGHLISMSKARGRKNSLNALVEHMAETAIEPDDQIVFISHGDCLKDAEYTADEIRRRF